MKVFLAFCIICPCYSLNGVYKYLCKCLNQCLSKCCCKNKEQYESISELMESTASSTINNIVQGNKIKLVRKNISLLWFQYCKLYVIGYTRYYNKRQPIKIIIEKNNSEDDVDNGETKNGCCFLECKKREDATCTHPCCCLRCSRQCCSQYGNESTCPDINIMCCNKYFPDRFLSKDITRAFVFLVKYLSQLATVPLLLLQIFDTYSFLCFSPDSYCSHTTEYKQHVVQAAITLFFYCSLVMSHLTSTLLIWNPWPHDEQSKPRPAPGNVNTVQKKKKCLFKCKAVQKKFEETFNDATSWTIYFLVDLKVVYIITFGLITIINLISSTATIRALTDKSSMTLFNVSSKYMNVNVTSINDAVLWNCRQFSETSDSYKFLYWMVIIVLIMIMSGLFLIKLISLIIVNSCCGFKCCIYRSSAFKHGLTNLWHIAIHRKLIELIASPSSQASRSPSSQASGYPSTQASGSPSSQTSIYPSSQASGSPSNQTSGSPSSQTSIYPSSQASGSPSSQTSGSPSSQAFKSPSSQASGYPSSQAFRYPSSQPSGSPSSQAFKSPSSQASGYPSSQAFRYPSSQPSGSPSSQASGYPSSQATEDGIINKDDIIINSYDTLSKKDIPNDIVKTLSCKNYCRSIIPYILLFLSIAIMCLAYSSYDLHPLACLVEPDEELITYEESKVELKFSTFLLFYQKIGGILVFCLGIIFFVFVRLFFTVLSRLLKNYRTMLHKK